MSAAPSDPQPAGSAYAADYAEAFDGFVRSMRRQGFLVDDRILEAAHVRAERAAQDAATMRGQRSLPFRALAAESLAQARQRYGY
jgi:hypothetical protein